MAGTVTGISPDLDDNNRIKSVSVRETDGSLQEISATLVIGAFPIETYRKTSANLLQIAVVAVKVVSSG
jgi:hypothetical protein